MDAEEIIETAEQGADVTALTTTVADGCGGMTLRDRWRRAMHFQRVDRLPNFEFGYWAETLTVWHEQGLPDHVVDEKTAYAWFGIEDWRVAPVNVMGLKPGFEPETLEEKDGLRTYRDANGFIAQINITGHKSIPHYLDFPLKDRRTWEEDVKPRLVVGDDRRPANWDALAEIFNRRDYPLAIPIGSMIGYPRNLIGFENIALMIYDDPELLEEIVDTMCDVVCGTIEPMLKDVEFDFGAGWEDICFNSGPIVGADFMRKVVAPRYRRITDLLSRYGCNLAWTDCDGNILPVIDSFLAGGINTMFPVEVNGGSDPVLMRQRWPELRMQGGFCKMRLAETRESISAEIERIRPVVEGGGFVPGVDHRVQADVLYDNYRYYLKLKRDVFGVGGTPQYDEAAV